MTNRVRVDVIVCVWSKLVQSLDFNSLGSVSFTNYCLALAQRGGLFTVVTPLELKMSSHALSCFLSDPSHINCRCPWRVWDLIIKSKFFLGWVISRDRITNDLCYTIDGGLLLVVYCQDTLGRSLSIISNEFLFKYLKWKCLSSQLTTKWLEIAALCMVCAVLSAFVRVVLLPVLINLCHLNTARPHFMLI